MPYILATALAAGSVVVWDLKESKPWCTLRDAHRASVSDLAWNPEDGLYLVTASDDDLRPVLKVRRAAVCGCGCCCGCYGCRGWPSSPLHFPVSPRTLQIWDLRSSTSSPLCELSGHSKGILSVDWCPWDPRLVISAGKDGHTFVWDITQGRAIAEIPAGVSGGGGGSPASASGGGGGGGGVSSGGVSRSMYARCRAGTGGRGVRGGGGDPPRRFVVRKPPPAPYVARPSSVPTCSHLRSRWLGDRLD